MLYIRELLDIAQVSDQATDQVSDQASDQVSDQPTENGDNISAKIIAFCVEPRTIRQIMEHLQMNNRTYLRNTYIIPLLGSRLRMTQPDKPNHPNQMYVAIWCFFSIDDRQKVLHKSFGLIVKRRYDAIAEECYIRMFK